MKELSRTREIQLTTERAERNEISTMKEPKETPMK
jgi:hypothetical protein